MPLPLTHSVTSRSKPFTREERRLSKESAMHTRFASISTRKSLTRISLLIVVTVALAGSGATGSADAGPTQSLEGAWNVKIEFDTPGVEGCTAPGMITRDGGVIAAGCSLAESPGYGQWVRTGNRRFGITFVGHGFDLT